MNLYLNKKGGFDSGPLSWSFARAIIALIIFILLFLGGTKLFGEIKINQDLTRAKATLETLKEEIAKVELVYQKDSASILVKEVLIPNPLNWEIISFSAYDLNNKPKECTSGGNCLCFCPVKTIKSPNLPQCEIKAACAIVSNLTMFNPILIHPTELTYVYIKKVNEKLVISETKPAQEIKNG